MTIGNAENITWWCCLMLAIIRLSFQWVYNFSNFYPFGLAYSMRSGKQNSFEKILIKMFQLFQEQSVKSMLFLVFVHQRKFLRKCICHLHALKEGLRI